MKILKFGGTSVGKPERMHHVAELITRDDDPKIVVLSAVSGTTNALVLIGETLKAKKQKEAVQQIDELYDHYIRFYKSLVKEENYQVMALEVIDEHFKFIKSLPGQYFNERLFKELLAQGELLSTKLFTVYLKEANIAAELLPALEYMSIDENKEPEIKTIGKKLSALLKQHEGKKVFITQGYICRNHEQEVDNLQRGGSDYTASLAGAAIQASEVQIWTDIDGMHNNDPRIVKNTFPVEELSFNEASELAYFGAKILHPSSILPAQRYNVPVKLLNTMAPEAKGTTISAEEKSEGIKAIAAKDGITAIKIKSSRMLLAYGFLRRVFEIFEKYRTPIDMVTTSEVAVSLTIDNNTHLDKILTELKEFGMVDVDKDQTIVCIVGNWSKNRKGVVSQVFSAIDDIPIRMISFGGSNYNISLLIDAQYKGDVLNGLNDSLF